MEYLSKEYGWLPSQIRNERCRDIDNYLAILRLKNLIEKREAKRHG